MRQETGSHLCYECNNCSLQCLFLLKELVFPLSLLYMYCNDHFTSTIFSAVFEKLTLFSSLLNAISPMKSTALLYFSAKRLDSLTTFKPHIWNVG